MDLSGQTILLTGGTGSFGYAFVERLLADHDDVTIRVYSRDELKQSEMKARFDDAQVRYMLGDIRTRTRILDVTPEYGTVHVEIIDAGADNRLTTVATVVAAWP